MKLDETEFQISQYTDGTLPPAERAALEVRLGEDPEARQLLAEYRRLNNHLAASFALPPMNWDRLAEHLSGVVAAAVDEPLIAGRIGAATVTNTWSWRARLAVAASVVVAVGAGVLSFETRRTATQPNPQTATASAIVTGPQVETSTGKVVEEITIGPSPALAARGESWHYAEGVVTRPSAATIAGDMKPPGDGDWHIH